MQIKENLDDLKKLQPLFKRVLGDKWEEYNFLYCMARGKVTSFGECYHYECPCDCEITITDNPRVPTFEELWGMVDWKKIRHGLKKLL